MQLFYEWNGAKLYTSFSKSMVQVGKLEMHPLLTTWRHFFYRLWLSSTCRAIIPKAMGEQHQYLCFHLVNISLPVGKVPTSIVSSSSEGTTKRRWFFKKSVYLLNKGYCRSKNPHLSRKIVSVGLAPPNPHLGQHVWSGNMSMEKPLLKSI